ncbi:unnamed protein product, partial [Symbiodinium microadriaticum]
AVIPARPPAPPAPDPVAAVDAALRRAWEFSQQASAGAASASDEAPVEPGPVEPGHISESSDDEQIPAPVNAPGPVAMPGPVMPGAVDQPQPSGSAADSFLSEVRSMPTIARQHAMTSGWVAVETSSGSVYYCNAKGRTTTFRRPHLMSEEIRWTERPGETCCPPWQLWAHYAVPLDLPMSERFFWFNPESGDTGPFTMFENEFRALEAQIFESRKRQRQAEDAAAAEELAKRERRRSGMDVQDDHDHSDAEMDVSGTQWGSIPARQPTNGRLPGFGCCFWGRLPDGELDIRVWNPCCLPEVADIDIKLVPPKPDKDIESTSEILRKPVVLHNWGLFSSTRSANARYLSCRGKQDLANMVYHWEDYRRACEDMNMPRQRCLTVRLGEYFSGLPPGWTKPGRWAVDPDVFFQMFPWFVHAEAYVECDPLCREIIAARMADGLIKKAKLISDVRKYTPETESNDFVGITAVIVTVSHPQGVSKAGLSRFAILENVGHLLSEEMRPLMNHVLEMRRQRVFIYARKPDFKLFATAGRSCRILTEAAMNKQVTKEWNVHAKPKSLVRWLQGSLDKGENKRLDALGNVVIPQCARLACHLFGNMELQMPSLSFLDYHLSSLLLVGLFADRSKKSAQHALETLMSQAQEQFQATVQLRRPGRGASQARTVDSLSDDDQTHGLDRRSSDAAADAPDATEASTVQPRQPGPTTGLPEGRRQSVSGVGLTSGLRRGPPAAHALRSKLAQLTKRRCKCRGQTCLQKLAGNIDGLRKLRQELQSLDKRDADVRIHAMLTTSSTLSVLQVPVCQMAFRILLGVGTARFRKLRLAAAAQKPAPLDGRFGSRSFLTKNSDSKAKREVVVQFLQELYETAAEPLPNVQGKPPEEAAALTATARFEDRRPEGRQFMAFRRHRGRRPRVVSKQRKPKTAAAAREMREMRCLPPGTFTDYLNLLNARLHAGEIKGHETVKKISLKLFNKVWAQSFHQLLSIREYSQHSKCASCIRHKMIVSRLGNDYRARQAQVIAYGRHLRRQYDDRLRYWRNRAQSRIRALGVRQLLTVCLIIDSIDHSKLRWPRSLVLQSKDFASFNRPHLTCTGVICHGYSALLCVSETHISADSSRTTEIIMHTLQRLQSNLKVDLRACQLVVQSDNCSKEGKNNTLLRTLSGLVASRRLARAELNFLESGHSHEDVDSWFALLAAFIEQHQEVHSPEAFVDLLNGFLRAQPRPHEEDRAVVKLDQGIGGPGAPHVLALDRYEDLQSEGALEGMHVDGRFWAQRGHPLQRGDVLLRTKQWMNQASYAGTAFNFLPASVARAMMDTVLNVEKAIETKAAQNWRKYAAVLRPSPANSAIFHERCSTVTGDAAPAAVDFNPALQQYHAARRQVHVYKAAARLWGNGMTWSFLMNGLFETLWNPRQSFLKTVFVMNGGRVHHSHNYGLWQAWEMGGLGPYAVCQESLVKFLKWVDKHFPEEDGVPTAQCYCKAMDLQEEGVVALRLLTDAGIPGVERLAASCIRPEFGLAPRFLLSTSAIRSDLSHMLAPMNVLFVKGWTRSLAAFTVLLAAYETSDSSSSDSAAPSLMEEWPAELQKTFCTAWANVTCTPGTDPATIVIQNRGITLQSTVRRRPNAFNLLTQMKVLGRMGRAPDEGMQAWQKASDLAAVYQIGPAEAKAAAALLRDIPPDIVEKLTNLVKQLQFTMARFITHEALASGFLSMGFAATGVTASAWAEQLLNTKDIISLMVARMHADHDGVTAKFMRKHADAELLTTVESTVPPVSLDAVGIFRGCLSKYRKEVQEEKNAADLEIANMMQSVNLKQNTAKVHSDLELLLQYSKALKDQTMREGKLDMMFLQKRCEKGQAAADNFLLTSNIYALLPKGIAADGPMLVDDALDVARTLMLHSTKTVLWVLGPQYHSSVEKKKVVTNKRLLEDKLYEQNEVSEVSLMFQVKDLWGSDGDGGVTPTDRAAQRGVQGSKEMLLALMDGLDLQKGQQVLVVELMTNRYQELGRACWELQKPLLADSGANSLDWRFISLASEEDESLASVETKRQHIQGLFLKEYWDDSFEAGPKQRPEVSNSRLAAPSLTILAMNNGVPKSLGCTCCQSGLGPLICDKKADAGTDCRLPDMVVESLGPAGRDLEKTIEKFRQDHAADLQHLQAQSNASPVERGSGSRTTPTPPSPARRTSCVPVYRDGEEIFDAAHIWEPENPLTVTELESSKT